MLAEKNGKRKGGEVERKDRVKKKRIVPYSVSLRIKLLHVSNRLVHGVQRRTTHTYKKKNYRSKYTSTRNLVPIKTVFSFTVFIMEKTDFVSLFESVNRHKATTTLSLHILHVSQVTRNSIFKTFLAWNEMIKKFIQ